MQEVNEYIDQHSSESMEELFQLVRMPSVSARGEAITETAEHLAQTLQTLGFETRIMPKNGGGQPVLYAEQAGASERTLLIYNHYDVQPPEPLDEWQTEPFEPTRRDGKVYGRGISDDKGNLVARIAAIRAIKETRGQLPARIKFLIEGDEEIGSPLFEEFVEEHRELLKADACVWEGSGVDPQGRPLLPLGVKGLLYVELSCRTVVRDVHSAYAAVVPNPAWRLTWALSTLKDQEENVLVKGFYNDVRKATKAEKAAINKMPAEEKAFARSIELERFVLGVEGVDFRQRLHLQPTCNIDGLTSGYQGPGSKTISPARASAKLDFRLVPDQDPHDIARKVRKHLDKHGFSDIQMEILGAEHPARTPIEEDWVGVVHNTLRSVYGKEPVLVPSMAGTGPMYPVVKLLGVPTADTGVSNIDSRYHAPNENIREEDFVMGIKAAAAVIDAFGSWSP
ncbi:MAG TPA: M20/M25/M40 family metallo-hydrolase [Dehalococcoidia bacterium]|nr:M20/M25/M40 family metallo-hydrolase [Dehalococcoidia bacterium]